MNINSKSFWPLVAAIGLGVSFVGCCVYFDYKRRNASNFQKKLKAERKKQKQRNYVTQIDTNTLDEMRRFSLEEIQQGEVCLSHGDLNNGIEHLARAVAICSQPGRLLGLFQQTLSPELFREITMRLPTIAQTIRSSSSSSPEPNLE